MQKIISRNKHGEKINYYMMNKLLIEGGCIIFKIMLLILLRIEALFFIRKKYKTSNTKKFFML